MITVRFLHTADWQLGMTQWSLGPDARARYAEARLAAIRAIGDLAAAQDCAFVLVCGDVFESSHVGSAAIARSLDAMRAIPVPVYLLPGAGDPLDGASVYRREAFAEHCPDHVRVLDTPGPHAVADGAELIAAPWLSRRPAEDLVARACQAPPPSPDVVRVVAGHGAVDHLEPGLADPAMIRGDTLREAVRQRRADYVALGGRHSLAGVGIDGRVWFPGTPEATDAAETDPGHVLVVDLAVGRCEVIAHPVGAWRFLTRPARLDGPADVDSLSRWFAGLPGKDRTVVRLDLSGALSLRGSARLADLLAAHAASFAALEAGDPFHDVATEPDASDLADLGLAGFAVDAFAALRRMAAVGAAERDEADSAGQERRDTAAEALRLLYRLAAGPLVSAAAGGDGP